MSQHSVCSFCRENVLRAETSWNYHHPSYKSLKSSAQYLCVFCRLLFSDVFSQLDDLKSLCTKEATKFSHLKSWLEDDVRHADELGSGQGSKTKSLYRWSFRKLGRTRESKVVIAVTFRMVLRYDLADDTKTPPNIDPYSLPERVFFCFPESNLGVLLSQAQLGPSTNPDVNDGVQIKSWVRKCGIEHKNCPKRAGATSKFVPTRLLHVGGKQRGQPIRIVDTKSSNIAGPYMTLSHCWGPRDDTRRDLLTKNTMSQFMREGIPWDHLSRNFRQAVEVTRFLEIDYLWIDSLCILQGDAVEWQHEGALMHKVYRNSYCNIAAADAKDTKGGLFRSRAPQDVLPAKFDCWESTSMFEKGPWRVVRADLWDHGLLQRPLYKRGWVFQERMLAPRILHFSRHQIFWDCAEMSACESIPDMLPLPLDSLASIDRHWRGRLQEGGTDEAIMLSATNDELVDDFWRAAVENYTGLELTNQYDKRLAVWSIAKLVRDILKERYVVGLWELALEEQLGWRVADCAVAERPKELADNPSWSWTSIKGKVLIRDRQQTHDREYRVMNHDNERISFVSDDIDDRPKLPRKPSGDTAEELAIMGDELKMVDEKRRKSSAASRQNSDVSFFALRHNSQIGATSGSGTNTPVGPLTMSPQPISVSHDQKQADSKIIHNLSRDSRSSEPVPGSLGRTASHIQLDAHLRLSSTQHGSKSTSSQAQTRDQEPNLIEKGLPIMGVIGNGLLQYQSSSNSWHINYDPGLFVSQSTVIDAYPDIVTHTKEDHVVQFLVLALTRQQSYDYEFEYPPEEPDAGTFYTGQGIIIEHAETNRDGCPCYTRTGAFTIRTMDSQTWTHMRSTQKIQQSVEPNASNGNTGVPQKIILF